MRIKFSILFLLLNFSTSVYASNCEDRTPVDILDTPFVSSWGAYDAISCLEESLAFRGDRRAIFSSIYKVMTFNIATAIDGGQFYNKEWLSRYTVHFANLYREAFYNFEVGDYSKVPETWMITFNAALEGKSLILQDAVMGINSHINRDLAHSIAAAGLDGDRDLKYQDHIYVNEVLGVTFEKIISMLSEKYGPGINNMVNYSPETNEVMRGIFDIAVTGMRDESWKNAVALTDGRWFTKWYVASKLEQDSRKLSNSILLINHTFILHEVLRVVEGSSDNSQFCQQYNCE